MIELKYFTPFAEFKIDNKYRIKTYLSLKKNKDEFLQNLLDKKCIGIVIMMNPGSSEQLHRDCHGLQIAKPDPTMEAIEKCWDRAFEIVNITKPRVGYIEIFNLFNICKPKSEEAVRIYKRYKHLAEENQYMETKTDNIINSIPNETPWTWLAWGCKKDPVLDNRRKEIEEEIYRQIPENKIIKLKCKNNENGFRHPKPQIPGEMKKIIEDAGREISHRIN